MVKGKYFLGWAKSFWMNSPELIAETIKAIKDVEEEGYWAVMFKVPKKREIEFIHELEKHIELKMTENDKV
jgi:pseudouridine-5'-phosphate glycosidase